MNITNYMSAIVSEVQQFGRAYVDSLVTPNDDKGGNEEIDNVVASRGGCSGEGPPVTARSKRRKSSSGIRSMSSSSSMVRPFHHDVIAVGSHDGDEGLAHRPHTASPTLLPPQPEMSASVPVGSASISGTVLHEERWGGEGPSMDEQSSSVLLHPVPEAMKVGEMAVAATACVRRASGNRGRVPRLKFGAVKIVVDHVEALETLPVVAAPASSPDLSRSKKMEDDGSKMRKVEFQPVHLDTVAPPPPPVEAEAGSSSFMPEPEDWARRRCTVLQLLRTTMRRRSAVRGETPAWARDVICRFVEVVLSGAILPVVEEGNNNSTAGGAVSTTTTTSVFHDHMWREAEVALGRSVTSAIPHKVLAPSCLPAVEGIAVAAKGDLELSEKSVVSPFFSGGSELHRAFKDALGAVRQWHDDRRLYSFLQLQPPASISSSSSKHTLESGMSELLSSCYAPLVRVAVVQGARRERCCLQEQLELILLEEWAKEAMLVFCATIREVDTESWQLAFGGTPIDGAKAVDAAENAIHSATIALWLMREATILTLLVVWALSSSVP